MEMNKRLTMKTLRDVVDGDDNAFLWSFNFEPFVSKKFYIVGLHCCSLLFSA